MAELGSTSSLECAGSLVYALTWVLLLACLELLLRVACRLPCQPQPPKVWSTLTSPPGLSSSTPVDNATSKANSEPERPIRRLNLMGLLSFLLPHIISALETMQLWAVAVACLVRDAPLEQGSIDQYVIVSAVVAFIDMPLILIGCHSPGSQTSVALGWLFPHVVFLILLLLSLAEGMGEAVLRCCKRTQRKDEPSTSLLVEEHRQPLSLVLKQSINDALGAHVLHLRVSRVSMARQAFRGLRCAASEYGPKVPNWMPSCGAAGFWVPLACLAVFFNVVVPSAFIWHYMPLAKDSQRPRLRYGWAKTLSFTAPCELWAKAQQISDLLIVGCFEIGLSCGSHDARQLWFIGAKGILLADIFFMAGRRWQLRSASVNPFLVERIVLLFSFYLLLTAPHGDIASAAEVISVLVMMVAICGLLAITICSMRSRKPDHLDGWFRDHERQFCDSARELPKMALHIMTASHHEFRDFCERLSHDDTACLEVAGAIVKRRLCTSHLVSSVASLSAQWALGVASSSHIENKLDMLSFQSLADGANRFTGDDHSQPTKFSTDPIMDTADVFSDARWANKIGRIQSQSCGAIFSGFTCTGTPDEGVMPSTSSLAYASPQRWSKSCFELTSSSSITRRTPVNSRSLDDLLRSPGPLVKSMQEGGSIGFSTVFDPSAFRTLRAEQEHPQALPSSAHPQTGQLERTEPLEKISAPSDEQIVERRLSDKSIGEKSIGEKRPSRSASSGGLGTPAQKDCADDYPTIKSPLSSQDEANWDSMSGKTIMTSFTTISEQGRRDLKKANTSGLGVEGITGEEVKASGHRWVSTEAEQSKALMQRYAIKDKPEEKRMTKMELVATRRSSATTGEKVAGPSAFRSQCTNSNSQFSSAFSSSANTDLNSSRFTSANSAESTHRILAGERDKDKASKMTSDLRSDCNSSDLSGDSRDRSEADGPEKFDSLVREMGLMESSVGSQSFPTWDSQFAEKVDDAEIPQPVHRSEGEESVRQVGEAENEEQSLEWTKWRKRKEARKDRLVAKQQKKDLLNKRNLEQKDSRTTSRFHREMLDAGAYHSSGSQRSYTSRVSTSSRCSTLDAGIFQLAQNFSQRRREPSEADAGSREASCDSRKWQVPQDQESHRRSWGGSQTSGTAPETETEQ